MIVQSEDEVEVESDDVDENFDWFTKKEEDDSYFVFVNNNRKPFLKGSQVYYNYGNRSNTYLLTNYSFCFMNNKNSSFPFNLRLDCDLTQPFITNMVDLIGISNEYQPVRYKKNMLCKMTLAYLRSILKQSFFKDQQAPEARRILLSRPKNIDYEIHVFKFYQAILEFIERQLARKTTLHEDLDLL
jgi:hypothetical protein